MEKSRIDEEYLKEIEKARRELRALIYKEKCAPHMLRLAWQDACSYDPESKIRGGPNGCIRSEQVLKRQENKGLDKALQLCEQVKAKLKKVSYADLYQLAGVVAVEVTGGPSIRFVPGREDSDEPPQEGRIPNPHERGVSHLRDIFTTRMGLTDQDIVALFGGQVLVRTIYPINNKGETSENQSSIKGKTDEATEDHSRKIGKTSETSENHSSKTEKLSETSKDDFGKIEKSSEASKDHNDKKGIWTSNPLKFDNSYFVELLKNDKFTLNMDKALVEDRKFRKYVEKYAKDKDAFLKDYEVAHKKLSELGFSSPFMFPKVPPEKLEQIKPKAKRVLGILMVSVAILGYLRKRKSNQLKT
ncbi:L-ascorbate peroxidase 5, peroxisomal-like [Cajanus cajan]|uniref:L-ascorbate peroxidase 5, peroxisomal-like n=1 Tax=Cajanus cajan TaxID=3821 RepID=UPI00098D8C90|nr:L-ascorbate peroxidase 5, peroxisomal-like [Cajanus cajan]